MEQKTLSGYAAYTLNGKNLEIYVDEYSKPKTAVVEYGKRKIKHGEQKFFEIGIECTLRYNESSSRKLINDVKKTIQRHYLHHNSPPLEISVGWFGAIPI